MGIRPDNTCLFIKNSVGGYQPVVQNRCFCGELVDVLTPGDDDGNFDWCVSRVRGDSANGYRLDHVRCLENFATVDVRDAFSWEEEYGIRILDPDGWRVNDGVTMHMKISREDFEKRASISTIKGTFSPQTLGGR